MNPINRWIALLLVLFLAGGDGALPLRIFASPRFVSAHHDALNIIEGQALAVAFRISVKCPRDHIASKLASEAAQANGRLSPVELKVFSGELARFTHMTPQRFIHIYPDWLLDAQGTPLEAWQRNEIARFAALLEDSHVIWRHPVDAVEYAPTIGELYESLKQHERFPGVCDMAAKGTLRIVRANGFTARHVQRRDPITSQFNNYVEAAVAGRMVILDLAAEFWEMAPMESPVPYRFAPSDAVGVFIVPQEVIESPQNRRRSPMYTDSWPPVLSKVSRTDHRYAGPMRASA